MTLRLTKGQQPPAFRLPDSTGNEVALADFDGRGVVVYFYPKAATPGCTTEACDFRDNLASLQSAGYDVVGISPDSPDRLASFAANFALTYPLLADPDHKVARQWGAWGEKVINGQSGHGVLRSTVILGADGCVSLADYEVAAEGHVAELRRRLAQLV
ncbi:peroxiredoxin [Paenarthrobacter sp. Z7-10]|uniref:peroxiredoxin n=1 Tax=Paenarthrobacter sp. Z7-10 TaxID=2787635 RepID=UPI0022A9225F|nr:peroxiredoxin [Paenarthrobacter sp. Z7-10]MCZ2403396.1 peroxiredoxin [Paenarthrobacter sp. Z7-10]